MTDSEMTDRLHEIANRLRTRRNDPDALMDFRILVQNANPTQRRDLMDALQGLLLDANRGCR